MRLEFLHHCNDFKVLLEFRFNPGRKQYAAEILHRSPLWVRTTRKRAESKSFGFIPGRHSYGPTYGMFLDKNDNSRINQANSSSADQEFSFDYPVYSVFAFEKPIFL